jgi:hypothetical protein
MHVHFLVLTSKGIECCNRDLFHIAKVHKEHSSCGYLILLHLLFLPLLRASFPFSEQGIVLANWLWLKLLGMHSWW